VGSAIILVRGKQFRVTEGEIIHVPSFAAEPGSTVQFNILARTGSDGAEIGSPQVEGASVTGTVVEQGRERKIIVFRKKRKKQYKKTHGHRQNFTAVRIDAIGGAKEDSTQSESAGGQ